MGEAGPLPAGEGLGRRSGPQSVIWERRIVRTGLSPIANPPCAVVSVGGPGFHADQRAVVALARRRPGVDFLPVGLDRRVAGCGVGLVCHASDGHRIDINTRHLSRLRELRRSDAHRSASATTNDFTNAPRVHMDRRRLPAFIAQIAAMFRASRRDQTRIPRAPRCCAICTGSGIRSVAVNRITRSAADAIATRCPGDTMIGATSGLLRNTQPICSP